LFRCKCGENRRGEIVRQAYSLRQMFQLDDKNEYGFPRHLSSTWKMHHSNKDNKQLVSARPAMDVSSGFTLRVQGRA
jgi:hypothetical protein